MNQDTMTKNKTTNKSKTDGNKAIIKKYANRRLYNMNNSSYITLSDLKDMVKEGIDFVVYDAQSQEDLTGQILTQIILEQEIAGHNVLPVNFLRWLISFYDTESIKIVPKFLDSAVEAFTQNSNKMNFSDQASANAKQQSKSQQASDKDSVNGSAHDDSAFTNPVSQFQEISRRNVEMFQNAFDTFSSIMSGGNDWTGQQKPSNDKKSDKS